MCRKWYIDNRDNISGHSKKSLKPFGSSLSFLGGGVSKGF
ncbi:MAG: hypothetical protein [Podoviridae sp. ctviO18]|nr:MAG: hypothetical protein [Podoviridae sp. ctviO18]